MMENLYHILWEEPALEKEEMYSDLEKLATKLCNTGRLRIDNGHYMNFVRFKYPELAMELMISYRELYDKRLLPRTYNTLKDCLSYSIQDQDELKAATKKTIINLRKKIQKVQKIQPEIEKKIARIILQSIHPSVIMIIIIELVEIFVSFDYTVGDMLKMRVWEGAKYSSGLQSIEGNFMSSVFISCGGNPFMPDSDSQQIHGDGRAALARMMVIGGQELAHFSDIKRNKHGQKVGRYSSNFAISFPKEPLRSFRINDIQISDQIYEHLKEIGCLSIAELENDIKFYKKNKVNFLYRNILKIIANYKLKKMIQRADINYQGSLMLLARHNKKYPANNIIMAIQDMRVNLNPQADAYKNKNKSIEEAILCAESIARIPQQVNKWGHTVTSMFLPNLYKFYYKVIIPDTIKAYETLSNKKYNIKYNKPWKYILHRLLIKIDKKLDSWIS